MSDRLVLLGTKGGPAVRTGGAMPTSSFLELAQRKAVVDCGIGATRALVNAGTNHSPTLSCERRGKRFRIQAPGP